METIELASFFSITSTLVIIFSDYALNVCFFLIILKIIEKGQKSLGMEERKSCISVILLKMYVGLLIQLSNVHETKIPLNLCNHSPITESLHTQIFTEIHEDINVSHIFTTIFM